MADVEAVPRGIPKALFISNIDEWMKKEDRSIEDALNFLQEQLSKYKFMFAHLEQRQKALMSKVPEIKKSLEVVALIAKDQALEVDFEQADTLFTRAHIPATNRVNLWLGANVMVEYNCQEAIELLTEKLSNANNNIEELAKDLGYLREQITTMEVNIARVYNWNVKRAQQSKQ